jgi:hypothetical protein
VWGRRGIDPRGRIRRRGAPVAAALHARARGRLRVAVVVEASDRGARALAAATRGDTAVVAVVAAPDMGGGATHVEALRRRVARRAPCRCVWVGARARCGGAGPRAAAHDC